MAYNFIKLLRYFILIKVKIEQQPKPQWVKLEGTTLENLIKINTDTYP